jgi:hypothetical protein
MRLPSRRTARVLLAMLVGGALFMTGRYTASRNDAGEFDPATERYEIVSYEPSGEWVIHHVVNAGHTRVKITALCQSYKWADKPAVEGPDSCDLIVGQTLVPNRLRMRPGEFLDIWQLGEQTLFMRRGEGADVVSQQFSIVSAKVL